MVNIEYDMRNDLTPKRLAIAMWDYSWIYGHYKGGAFESFDKAIYDLIERGFNAVRIDCFPLIIGMLSNDEQKITIPGSPMNAWGVSDIDRKHDLMSELIEFMKVTKEKGIYVILSNWNLGCIEFPNIKDYYAGKHSEFCRAWEKTLNILKDHDLLEHVVYVDMDQEFPYFSPFASELGSLTHSKNDTSFQNEVGAMEEAGRVKNSDDGFAWNSAQMSYVYGDLRRGTMLTHIGKTGQISPGIIRLMKFF